MLVKVKLWSQETFDELSFVEAFSKHIQVPEISTCAVWMHLCPVHTHLQDTVVDSFLLTLVLSGCVQRCTCLYLSAGVSVCLCVCVNL